MLRTLVAPVAMLAMLMPAPAQAWGFFAHRTTADIAEANITQEARGEIRRLLRAERRLGTPGCPVKTLRDASVWPDCIRRDRVRWAFTAPWHYRTTPICEAYNPRTNCANGNCVTAQIDRAHAMLGDRDLPDHIRLEALAFLVHFVGDLHMPLHSGDLDDKGGNDRMVYDGTSARLNLHSLWDGRIAEIAIRSAETPVVRAYSAQERVDLGGGNAAEWGRESWQIAREFIYPTFFETADVCDSVLPNSIMLNEDHVIASLPIARRRVQQAGIRMAALLDSALGPQS